jgi:hypothetical protein
VENHFIPEEAAKQAAPPGQAWKDLEPEAGALPWDAREKPTGVPVCPSCRRRTIQITDPYGRPVFTCHQHGAVAPEWVGDPLASESRGVAAFPAPVRSLAARPRSLSLGDVRGAVRAPRPAPEPAADYLDPPPQR